MRHALQSAAGLFVTHTCQYLRLPYLPAICWPSLECAWQTAPFTSRSSKESRIQSEVPFLAFLKEELAALSIPTGELSSLASTGLSPAALTAWALTKTSIHPAADKAAAASQRLRHLLCKLDGAMLRQEAAASSPAAELLWHVAVEAARQQLRATSLSDLDACVEYLAAQASLRSQRSSVEPTAAVQFLEQQLPQLVDTSPRNALATPAFWQLAAAAAEASQSFAQDLALLGYDLAAAIPVAGQQLQQVQQLLGLDAAVLQQQLLTQLKASANILLPDQHAQLMHAVSGNAGARSCLAQLQLLQVVAAALGRSAVQLVGPASSAELVRRLTGRGPAVPDIPPELSSALQASGPALVSAVVGLPAQRLASPSVDGLLQLLQTSPNLQALHKALTAWRAAAAVAGSLPVLTSLCAGEVSGLTQSDADALGRQLMGLEARGRLLLRGAAAGGLDLSGLSGGAVEALTWKVHTGGADGAEEVVQLVLAQAADTMSQLEADAESAGAALTSLSAGFTLEEATSRLNTAAPPSAYVMAGIPQLQLQELSEAALPSDSDSPDSSSNGSRRLAGTDAAEQLVRDLALLLTTPDSSSGGVHTGGAAAAAERLQVLAHDLPRVLSGPLLQLLAAFQPHDTADAAGVKQRQQLLNTFVQVAAVELPRHLVAASAESGAASSADARGSGTSALHTLGGSVSSAAGLVELLGQADSAGVVAHASELVAAGARRKQEARDEGRGRRDAADRDPKDHLHAWLSAIHQDQDMQRYLQIEFEPSLELDVVHTPRGWRDPDLFTSSIDFLEAMRPLLDAYLAAQGEVALQDLEWQVYQDAALAEAEAGEAAAAAARHAAGHSPFHNSRADEAFLRERLQAGIPRDSVLYESALKYLEASFHNSTWRFAQRKHMVDLLIRIAQHLAAHPPRTHRGSPFSALFQPDGPPLVPRISRQAKLDTAAEAHTLPAGFGPQTALSP